MDGIGFVGDKLTDLYVHTSCGSDVIVSILTLSSGALKYSVVNKIWAVGAMAARLTPDQKVGRLTRSQLTYLFPFS